MSRNARITGGLAIAVAIAALGLTAISSQGWAQQGGEAEAQVRVGTYNPEQVFNAYPERERLMSQLTELQGQMQRAQQEQDQQQMMQLQQQMQQRQQEAIEQFENDVAATLPDVADEAQLDLVAIEVVWNREGVQSQDVTDEIIEGFGGEPVPQQPQFLVPDAQ